VAVDAGGGGGGRPAGLLVGRPTLRLKGHYLAMATLGLGVIISIVLTNEDRITGGPDGMSVPPLVLFGHLVQGEQVWYAIVGATGVHVWLALNLIDSPVGRALRALHGSEVAAATLGIDAAGFKLRVFVISAVMAAVAGAMTAHYSGFLTPAKASFLHSVELVIMVVFGGMASVWGAVVGAAVLTLLPQFLTVFEDYEMMVFGARPGGHDGLHAARHRAHAGPLAAEVADERAGHVEHLSKGFGGVRVIEDLSFEVAAAPCTR
jgi:branched-chain amino acid transport system permease protein